MSICFVTSFDENYYDISKVAVKTLGENSKHDLDVICLVPPKLMPREQEYINSISQSNLRISFRYDKRFMDIYGKEGPQSGYITSNCNHRIFLASVCDEYRKAIYFDSDTIFLRDIEPLINFKFFTIIAAVQEFSDMNVISFNDPDRPYFNNGVFLADLDAWRASGIERQLLKWQEINGITSCPEQDAMNGVLLKHWTPLPVSFNSFNYLYSVNPIFAAHNKNPMIVHFVGPDKPWKTGDSKYDKLWREKLKAIHENT